MKAPHYKLRVPDDLAELIRTMHPHLKKKVKAAFQTIAKGPDTGKALRDQLTGLRSFRVSRFRIIYRVAQKKQIDIVAIGPRKNVYEETYRILRKKST
jgi:mRNA interferase RelE/StbE